MSHAPAALHEIAVRPYANLDPELGETVARAAAEHEIDPRILASLDHSPRRLELYLVVLRGARDRAARLGSTQAGHPAPSC